MERLVNVIQASKKIKQIQKLWSHFGLSVQYILRTSKTLEIKNILWNRKNRAEYL
jgi:hypothetical protein